MSNRDHYIPQLLIRNFCDETGLVFVLRRKLNDSVIFKTNPSNIFLEGNLYTEFAYDGKIDRRVDRFLTALESLAAPVVKKIIEETRRDIPPNLSEAEKQIWDAFFYHQWARVPEISKNILKPDEFENVFFETVGDYEKEFGPIGESDRKLTNNPKYQESIIRNAMVRAVALPGQRGLRLLSSKGIAIARIRHLKKSFVLGSIPIVKLNHRGRRSLADPETEAWIPIAPDIMVSPGYERGRVHVINLDHHPHIRHINVCMARQSSAIISKSENLLRSLKNIF